MRSTGMTAHETWRRYLWVRDNLVDLIMQSKSLFAAFRRLVYRINRKIGMSSEPEKPAHDLPASRTRAVCPRSRRPDTVRTSFGAFIGGIGLIATSGVAIGHHSIAMFDRVHPIQLIGTVLDYK